MFHSGSNRVSIACDFSGPRSSVGPHLWQSSCSKDGSLCAPSLGGVAWGEVAPRAWEKHCRPQGVVLGCGRQDLVPQASRKPMRSAWWSFETRVASRCFTLQDLKKSCPWSHWLTRDGKAEHDKGSVLFVASTEFHARPFLMLGLVRFPVCHHSGSYVWQPTLAKERWCLCCKHFNQIHFFEAVRWKHELFSKFWPWGASKSFPIFDFNVQLKPIWKTEGLPVYHPRTAPLDGPRG